MTRHSAAKKYSSRTVCQIDSNVHFADHCSHAITPQWCQYQTGSPHWQCVDRVEDKYTCILQQATCWQRPLLLCPQVDRSTAPLKSIPALRLVGGPANRSLVAASRLMKERLMSRKLDTGQETEKRPRRGYLLRAVRRLTLRWKLQILSYFYSFQLFQSIFGL